MQTPITSNVSLSNYSIVNLNHALNQQAWTSLAFKLGYVLKDSFKTKVMIHHYESGLKAEIASLGCQEEFEEWLLSYGPYLGSSQWDPFQFLALQASLNHHLSPAFKSLDNFFKSIYQDFSLFRKKSVAQTSYRVNFVILTTTRCGQGHLSAALGMQKFLTRNYFSAPIIDRDTVQMMSKSSSKSPYRSPYRQEHLRDLIANLGPRLIFSTASHDWNDLSLSFELEIPMRLIQTDYEMHPSLSQGAKSSHPSELIESLFETVSGSLIKIWIATKKLDKNSEEVKTRIGEAQFSKYVESFGFPIRASFKREEDPFALAQIRQRLGIELNEHVILMTYGGREEGDLLTLVEKLNETTELFNHPLYVAVICGNNDQTLVDINHYLASNKLHPQMRFKIERVIQESEMADYAKVASIFNPVPGLMLGKTGGSTTAENSAMGVYTLAILDKGSGPSEEANLQHLKELGLGQALHSKSTLVSEIKNALKKNIEESRTTALPQPLDWESHLLQFCKTFNEAKKANALEKD